MRKNGNWNGTPYRRKSSLKSEFNVFLFAPIGKNSDGMQVSVLSGWRNPNWIRGQRPLN